MTTKSYKRATLGGLALLLLFAAATAWLLTRPVETSRDDLARSEERIKAAHDLRQEDEKKLSTYAVLDKEKGLYQIPIKEAMPLTVTALNQKKPAPANPISTPAPAASPQASP